MAAPDRLTASHYDVRGIGHRDTSWEVHWMTRAGSVPTAAMEALRAATAEALAPDRGRRYATSGSDR